MFFCLLLIKQLYIKQLIQQWFSKLKESTRLHLYLSLRDYAVIQLISNNCEMEPVQRSSFHPLNPNSQNIHSNLLDQQCARLINTRESLEISGKEEQYRQLGQPMRLICAFYHSLSQKLEHMNTLAGDSAFSHNIQPLQHNIKYPLFKLILNALQKKLFISEQQQKYHEQITYSLAFKPHLLGFFLALVSENTNYVPLERFIAIHRALTSQQYPLYLPIQLYYLFGGSLFTIQSKGFREKVVTLIQNIAKTLSNSQTFISRNVEHYKNNKERKLILDESIKVVMLAKNKETLEETASNITKNLFMGRDYLSKEEFLHQVQNRPLDPTLSIFLLMLRSEFMLIQEKSFQSHLMSRSQASKTNFYTHEMTKLFNKCPFNGDERCNCKKCQCVRRNRESAKLNQQKKRNAVEQVEQMRKRIAQLEENQKTYERKMSDLEEQNMMLKSLLKEIRHNHTMKSSLLETIEPISKILNNEL